MRSRGLLFTGSVIAGALAGWYLAQERLERHRRDLFSRHPLKRMAALGFLAGQRDVESVRLLRDYVAWEPQPMLRRRGEALLRRMRASFA